MSSGVRKVSPELVSERFTVKVFRPPHKCAGFVMKALVMHEYDPTQIVISKNPGARHAVLATEQYTVTYDNDAGIYLLGSPVHIPLEEALERAPIPQAPAFDLVAIYVGAQLLKTTNQS